MKTQKIPTLFVLIVVLATLALTACAQNGQPVEIVVNGTRVAEANVDGNTVSIEGDAGAVGDLLGQPQPPNTGGGGAGETGAVTSEFVEGQPFTPTIVEGELEDPLATHAGGELYLTDTDSGIQGILPVEGVPNAMAAGLMVVEEVHDMVLPAGYGLLYQASNKQYAEPYMGIRVLSGGAIQMPHPDPVTLSVHDSIDTSFALYPAPELRRAQDNPVWVIGGVGQMLIDVGGKEECVTLGAYPLVMPAEWMTVTVKAPGYANMVLHDQADFTIDLPGVAGTTLVSAGCDVGPAVAEAPLWQTHDGLDQFAEASVDQDMVGWGQTDYLTKYGQELVVPPFPKASGGSVVPQISVVGASSAWLVSFGRNDFNLESGSTFQNLTPGRFGLRGDGSFTIGRTSELYRVFGADSKPGFGLTGVGYVLVEELNGRTGALVRNATFDLGTGRQVISLDHDADHYYQVTLIGQYLEIGVGPTDPTSSTDLRWPHQEQDGQDTDAARAAFGLPPLLPMEEDGPPAYP